MIKYVNKCEDCYDEGSFCLGNCKNDTIRKLICDECNEEVDVIHYYYGEELCQECLLKRALIKEYYND